MSSLPLMTSRVVLASLFICIPLSSCSLGPVTALALMTVFVFVLLILALFDIPVSAFRVSMPLMIFAGLNAFYLLRSAPTIPIAQQTIAVTIVPLVIAVICSACQRSPSLVIVVFRAIIWASIFQALLFFAGWVFAVPSDFAVPARMYGAFAINGVACASMLGRYYNVRYYAVALFITGTIAAGLSRTCTVVAVGILFSALTFGRSWWRAVIGLGYILALYCLWTYYISPLPVVKHRLSYGDQAFAVGSVTISSQGRVPLWHTLLREWSYSPLMGYGIASARAASILQGGLDHPHNDYIRVLYEYGLIGFGFWIFGIVWLIARYSRNWWRLETLKSRQAFLPGSALLAWIAFCAVMLTDNVMAYYFSVVPLACILGAAGPVTGLAWCDLFASNRVYLRPNNLNPSATLVVLANSCPACELDRRKHPRSLVK
jgi:O-antigen ligase